MIQLYTARLACLVLILLGATSAFGQGTLKTVAKYKRTERIGNFVTRWYYDIIGTSLVWKESLTLYTDSTYQHIYRGGECGTFDEDKTGKWTTNGDTLCLETDSEWLIWQYVRANSKLYDLDTDIQKNPRNWAMK